MNSTEDELIQRVHQLRYQMDNMEDMYRQTMRKQEEEDCNLHYYNQKLEDEWMDCGKFNPELENLLEEEQELLDSFRYRKSDIEEQIHYDFRENTNHIEDEIDELQRQLRILEYEDERGGDTQ